ncbi:MAG TPA: ParB/RepB/Spo0J family partition protein [Vicinamibacterales bacterium]|nr:ParB/RepB/Spo0J family partition protein [Vicinamibacterales bacterium]
MKTDHFGVRAKGVKTLPTNSLKPNPHNPRRLFDREDLSVLEESIQRVGILVPLTVYEESRTGDYVILDGQRRWICAQRVGLSKIPVNEVNEPTLVQNIVTMFQIHKLRKDWELMPTALKLELLMRELQERNDRRLAELTGLDEAVVARCKKLLSYPKKYQDMMLDPDPSNRFKADFFIELYAVRTDRVVQKFDWFKKEKFTDAMLAKWQAKALRSVTDFRIVKQHITNAARAGKIAAMSKRLREFAENPSYGPDHLNIGSAQVAASARKMVKTVNGLYEQVNDIDIDEFYGEKEMWDRLDALATLIREKLKAVGRREA